jgi:alanine dehydrogenase
MRLINEAQARTCVTLEMAIEAVEEAFCDLANGDARTLPVVREPLKNGKGTFGVKSGELDRHGIVGLKAGGYWPGNVSGETNLTNHQSSALLFDMTSGVTIAALEANWLTEARTAAAGAVAIRALSRPDSENLGIIGAGMQAKSQIEAALKVRPIRQVRLNARRTEQADALRRSLSLAYPAVVFSFADREETVQQSDILITVTPSNEALFPAQWVPEGQHINAMGADTVKKQELPTELLESATLFYDDRTQALSIGEFQRLSEGTLQGHAIGDVLTGKFLGRQAPAERTVFDSTGIALQDLAVAWLAITNS